MTMTTDPVCKMKVDTQEAAATAQHNGRTYYFCSYICHKAFIAEPGKYVDGAAPAGRS